MKQYNVAKNNNTVKKQWGFLSIQVKQLQIHNYVKQKTHNTVKQQSTC